MHILWLKTELLHPVDKGGRIRTYHMLRELRRDHRVTYLTLDDGSAAALLDEAEDFLNSVGPQVMAEVQAEHAQRDAQQPGWKRFLRRRRR